MYHIGADVAMLCKRLTETKFQGERYTRETAKGELARSSVFQREKTVHAISLWKLVNGSVRKTISYTGSRL